MAAANVHAVPETNLADCDQAVANTTVVVDLLPTASSSPLLEETQPDFTLLELRAFTRDTTPPVREESLMEAQLARLQAVEKRLIAQERQLAATQARLEQEAAKMEARSRELEAKQQKMQNEASKSGNTSRKISRSTSTSTTTGTGQNSNVLTGSAENNFEHDSSMDIKPNCPVNQNTLALSTDKITCLRDKLSTMLVEDGFLVTREEAATLILNPDNTLINGRQLPGRLYAKYDKLFNDHCIKAKAERIIQLAGKNISVGDMMTRQGVDEPYLVGTAYRETN